MTDHLKANETSYMCEIYQHDDRGVPDIRYWVKFGHEDRKAALLEAAAAALGVVRS